MTDKKEIVDFDVALKKDGKLVFSPHGTSMLPMIRGTQDIVVIFPVKDPSTLEKYDVVFYKRENGTFVLHRIIGKKGDHYLCCGDNQLYPEKVAKDSIFGILVGYYKDGVYVDVKTDTEYIKYAKHRVASRFFRRELLKKTQLQSKTHG